MSVFKERKKQAQSKHTDERKGTNKKSEKTRLFSGRRTKLNFNFSSEDVDHIYRQLFERNY